MIVYYIRADGSIIEDHADAPFGILQVKEHDPRLSGVWMRTFHPNYPRRVIYIEVTESVHLAFNSILTRPAHEG